MAPTGTMLNPNGIPTGLRPREMMRLMARRGANEQMLLDMFQGYRYVHIEGEPAARVHVQGPGLLFPSTLLNEDTAVFLTELDNLIQRAVVARSAALSQPLPPVDPVPSTFGRQYWLTPKLLAQMATLPDICTICREPLLPAGAKRRKVWQLHGPQCTFHIGCLRRWQKESSKCPNCMINCAE